MATVIQSSTQIVNRIKTKPLTAFFAIGLLFSVFLFVSGDNNTEIDGLKTSTDEFQESKIAIFVGSGTEQNPHLISSIAHLKLLRDNHRNFNYEYFKLTTDLFFTSSDYDDPNKGWLPIGNESHKFANYFNGDNHIIHDLWINQSLNNVGLFGFSSGIITSLHLRNVIIEYNQVPNTPHTLVSLGAIAGTNLYAVTDSSVASTITATGSNFTLYSGGLIGNNKGLINNAYANSTITSNLTTGVISTGGLTGSTGGFITGSGINNSSADSTITAISTDDIFAGGITGYANSFSPVANTFLNATLVTLTTTGTIYVGGLIGYGRGTTRESSVVATIKATATDGDIYAGGLIGYGIGGSLDSIANDSSSMATITTNLIKGTIYSGGLIGMTRGSVRGSYSESTIINNAEDANVITGGLIGFAGANIDSYGRVKTESDFSQISESYALATVDATTANGNITAGGLIGLSNVQAHDSYANSTINTRTTTGDIYAGGLVGNNEGKSIWSTYATGNISSTGARHTFLGGLVGKNDDNIRNSYAATTVHTTSSITDEIGGLVGSNLGSVSNSYYDNTISKTNDNNNGIPQTTTQLQNNNTHFSTWDIRVWVPGDGFFPVIQVAPNPVFTLKPDYQTVISGMTFTLKWAAFSENPTDYVVKVDNETFCSGSWVSGSTIRCLIDSAELNLGENYLSITVNGYRNTSSTYTKAITIVSPSPSVPTSLTASFQSSSVTLNWDVPEFIPTTSDGSSLQYRVYRAEDGGQFTLIGVTTFTEFSDRNLTPGFTYTYRVSASNSVGVSDFTKVEITIPEETAEYNVPTNVEVHKNGTDYIVAWEKPNSSHNLPSSSITYIVARSIDGGAFTNFTVAGIQNFYVDRNIMSGVAYTYKVLAIFNSVESEFSDTVSILDDEIIEPPNNLGIPTNLEVHFNYTNLVISWDKPDNLKTISESVKYNLVRSKDGAVFTNVYTGKESFYNDFDVAPGSIYAYKVSIASAVDESDFTKAVEFTFPLSSVGPLPTETVPLKNTSIPTSSISPPTSNNGFVFFPLISIPIFAIAIVLVLVNGRKQGEVLT